MMFAVSFLLRLFVCLFVVGGSSSCVFFRMDFGYVFGSV